jgi:hypothetical protein
MGLSAPGLAQGVRDPTVWQATQALETQCRTGAVAQQPLASLAIARRDDDAGVNVEAPRAACSSARLGGRGQSGPVVVDARSLGQRRELADAERSLEAGFERRAVAGLVARVALFLHEQSSPLEPRANAHLDVECDGVEIVVRRASKRVKQCALARIVFREHAVGNGHVVVNVEIQAAAEALREADRAAPCA